MRIKKTSTALAMMKSGIDTQKTLGEKAGLSQNTISSALRGAEVKFESVRKIAAALGVDPAEIIEGGK